MRVKVEHHTRYRFTEPQARVVQLLRLFPSDHDRQTVVQWRIDVDRDARLREGEDGYCNAVRMLYAEGPIDALDITVSGEVLVTDGAGAMTGTAEPFAPDLYLRETALTRPDAALLDFAHAAPGAGRETIDALTHALHDRFTIVRSRPDRLRSAAEAFATDRACPRDLAQMLIACARVRGIPARYVSGYSLAGDAAGTTPAPHGWAELYLDAAGWIAVDASIDGGTGPGQVRVAIGLDASDAAPIAGTRIGLGGEEALDVDVHVEAVGQR